MIEEEDTTENLLKKLDFVDNRMEFLMYLLIIVE